jgi:hypothetical protein
MTASSGSDYRAARRAFIAACERAQVDPIARLNPAPAPDGKPLFMDSAALGPRLAGRAVLAVANDAAGSALAVALLEDPIALPADARLVLVHAPDPATFAGVPGDPGWPVAALAAVATEDLSRVHDLAVLPLAADTSLVPILPHATVSMLPPAVSPAAARAAITSFFRR